MIKNKSIILSIILTFSLVPNVNAMNWLSRLNPINWFAKSATKAAVITAAAECTTLVNAAQPGMELVAEKFAQNMGKFMFVGTMQYIGVQSQAVISALSAKAAAAKALSIAIYVSPLTYYIIGGTITTYVGYKGVVHTYYYFNPSTKTIVETTRQHMAEAEAKLKLRKIEITREQVEIKASVDKAELNAQLAKNQTKFTENQVNLSEQQANLIYKNAELKVMQQAQAVSPQEVLKVRKLAPAMAKL